MAGACSRRLKHDLTTRHIPVCVISTDDARERALASGALSFVPKPIQAGAVLERLFQTLTVFLGQARRRLLVLAPEDEERAEILACVADENTGAAGHVRSGLPAQQALQDSGAGTA